jgi:hypothetical protein
VKRIGQQQTKHQPKHKKSYDVVLGYDFTTWMINFNPSYPFSLRPIGYIPVPFVWFIIPFIVLGILGSIAAWAGYQLMGIPRLRAPLSHYNPFRSRKKETKNDDKTK